MYQAAQNRYQVIPYRRCGASGLMLPAVSLGLWHNFGDTAPYENMRALCRTAFDHGITHFDLANNYGPEPGAAERNFGKILRDDLGVYRDELKKNYTVVIVTHNMQQAARISDRTAFFLLGELVEVGPTNQIFSTPRDKRTEDYISGRFG